MCDDVPWARYWIALDLLARYDFHRLCHRRYFSEIFPWTSITRCCHHLYKVVITTPAYLRDWSCSSIGRLKRSPFSIRRQRHCTGERSENSAAYHNGTSSCHLDRVAIVTKATKAESVSAFIKG